MAFVMPIFAGSSSLRPSGIPRVCITSSGSARKTFVSNGKKTIYARKEFGVFAEDKAFTFPTAEELARAEIAKARVKFFPEEDSEVAAAWNAQFESLLHIIQDLEKMKGTSDKPLKTPVRVAITGAAGSIGYNLLTRIAAGEMFGGDQPVILQCLEIPSGIAALEGIAMEMTDLASPLLKDIEVSDDAAKAFSAADFVLCVGARPRGPGMERVDLIKANAQIFVAQGQALNKAAKSTVKVVVVGNPANTNALIMSHFAPDIPNRNITAMTRLDLNRALSQLATRAKVSVGDIEHLALWGNHSTTMFPDVSNATIKGVPVDQVIDSSWLREEFVPAVQNRGAEVIKAMGRSSSASAANAALVHIRDWHLGSGGRWVAQGLYSSGEYGVPAGLVCSYPVVCEGGDAMIVPGLSLDSDYAKAMMRKTIEDLETERDMVKDILANM